MKVSQHKTFGYHPQLDEFDQIFKCFLILTHDCYWMILIVNIWRKFIRNYTVGLILTPCCMHATFVAAISYEKHLFNDTTVCNLSRYNYYEK